MEPLKLAGVILLVVSAVEVLAWRLLAPRNPRLNRALPLVLASSVGSAVIGFALLLAS